MHILTSVWRAQHPNSGQNIQHRNRTESRIKICYSGSKLLGNDQHNLGSNGKRYLQVWTKIGCGLVLMDEYEQ